MCFSFAHSYSILRLLTKVKWEKFAFKDYTDILTADI